MSDWADDEAERLRDSWTHNFATFIDTDALADALRKASLRTVESKPVPVKRKGKR